MVVECRHLVEEAGIPAAQITSTRSADMRYRGQGHEIQVDLESLGLPAPDLDEVLGRFRAEYRRLNAVDGPNAAVDAVTWRAVARGPVPRLPLTSAGIGGQNPRERRERRIYFHDAGGYLPAQIVPRETLVAGESVAGPAVIELGDASITVGPLAVAMVREDGLIVMKLNSDETHGH
jgi:N-methylhydantoinase A